MGHPCTVIYRHKGSSLAHQQHGVEAVEQLVIHRSLLDSVVGFGLYWVLTGNMPDSQPGEYLLPERILEGKRARGSER